MPKIFGNRFGNVSQADGYLDDKKSVYNLFDQYFSTRRGGWFSKVTASGGTEITTDDYKYHVFLSPGTLTVTVGGRVDYLVVGSGGDGGSGSSYISGGGGGGGVNSGTNYIINSPLPISVGVSPNVPGSKTSSFGPLTATSGTDPFDFFFFTPTAGESGGPNPYSGGSSPPSVRGAGGGGGAGQAGTPAPPSNLGGIGGNGKYINWISAPIIAPAIPSPVRSSWISAVANGYFGGGGGGVKEPTSPGNSGNSGGLGGGGSGAVYRFTPPNTDTLEIDSTNGVDYTGGGGGGGGPESKLGASGIVIIRYRI